MVNKKKIQKSTKEESTYFVSLKNPLELQRHLLESSRKSVYALQSYQKILLLRERKLKELAVLKQSLKELMYLNKKLNEKLPTYDYDLLHNPKRITKEDTPKIIKKLAPKIVTPEITPKVAAKTIQKPEQTPVKKLPPIREKTDLEKLEESLNNIEQKLQKINQ